MPRVLLFASTTGYQVHSFAEAAERLAYEVILATDRCHVLDDPWGDRAVPVQFDDPAAGFDELEARGPFDGVLAVGDHPALIAAQAAERLGLAFSPPDAVRATNSKFLARERFKAAQLLVPEYHLDTALSTRPDARVRAQRVGYPCVLKPLGLSGSRGVIRADDAEQFAAAFTRIRKLVEGDRSIHGENRSIQVEEFIPGREFALEGLVTRGRLQLLALFDKPDPLDGPFFEETIYVTPSREPEEVQSAIHETTQRAIHALGLTDGPIHAEMRVNDGGVWMLEIAARPIGGLCSGVLRFDMGENRDGSTLEEILLMHAAGVDVSDARLESGGHAVMMIPIPRAGVYQGVQGMDRARAVEGIADVMITAKEGQMMLPLPEGASYLGFIFGNAESPVKAEEAIRKSHACLQFEFSTALPVIA